MKNKNNWKPTKYIRYKGLYKANRNLKYVNISSRLIADLLAREYFSCIQNYAFGDLIDLGCGSVPLYEMYKSVTQSQTCVDWPNSLHENEYTDFCCDLNESLTILNDSFDTVVLSDVLEHIFYPPKLLKEIYRIMRKDGVLIVGVPFYYFLHEIPYDYYRYTEYSLKKLIEDTGYKVVLLNRIGGAFDVWGDITAKITKSIPYLGYPISNAIQFITLKFGDTRFGLNIRVKTAVNFPLAYIIVARK